MEDTYCAPCYLEGECTPAVTMVNGTAMCKKCAMKAQKASQHSFNNPELKKAGH